MNMKHFPAFIPCIIFALAATAAGGIPAITASVFSGGSWLRASNDDWTSTRRVSDVQQLARRANNGDVDAMRRLGIMSMRGEKVKKSAQIAAQWWKKAADRGDGRSMMYLGDVYSSGNGVRKDERLALRYYEKALESAGKDADEVEDDDNIVIKRIKEKLPLRTTISWWKKRCSKGNVHAMYYLGTLTKKKREGILNDEKAAEFLIQAAKAGHARAIKRIEKAPKEQYIAYWEDKKPSLPPVVSTVSKPSPKPEVSEPSPKPEVSKAPEDPKSEFIKKLSRKGITPDKYNTFLFDAYAHENYTLVDMLLKAGANPEATNQKGSTLLQQAAYDGDIYIAECLLSKGASSNETGKAGMPPLVAALSSDSPNPHMIQLLLETGANPGDSALSLAINKKNALIVRLLLKAGAKLQGINLLEAVSSGHAGIVRQILQAGADINFRNAEKQTAMDIAVKKGYTEIADILQKAGER